MVDKASTISRKPQEAARITSYEFIDSAELAKRLSVPETWIREYTRSRTEDTIPHIRLGRYVRFAWGSPELEEWLRRRMNAIRGHRR